MENMKPCPICRVNAWPLKLYGIHPCPNCKSQFRLTASHIEPHVSVRQVRRQPKASRDNVVIAGRVMCACCNRPFPLADCVDGRIDGDGTKTINVQIGWTFDAGTLTPAFQQRFIPRTVRGMICSECFVSYHGREVFTADARLKRKQSLPDAATRSNTKSDLVGRRQFYEVDTDPTWAHTGDKSWCSALGIVNVVQQEDGSIRRQWNHASSHPSLCPCSQCLHRERVEIYDPVAHIDRSIYRGPLSSLQPKIGRSRFTCIQFDNRLDRSPNPRRIGHSRRERVGRGLTLADTLSAAVRHAIALGDASAASRYARMAARHPAARRYTAAE